MVEPSTGSHKDSEREIASSGNHACNFVLAIARFDSESIRSGWLDGLVNSLACMQICRVLLPS